MFCKNRCNNGSIYDTQASIGSTHIENEFPLPLENAELRTLVEVNLVIYTIRDNLHYLQMST